MGPRCCRVAAVRVWEVGVQGRRGWYAAGSRWQQSWWGLALVVEVAMVVAWSWCGCDGEGVTCVHTREVGVAMMW